MSELSVKLRSSILCGPVDLSIIMPSPEVGASTQDYYKAKKKFKVLWLLHAGNGDGKDWLGKVAVQRHAENRECIIVMPSAINSDFANHPQFAYGYNYSDFFFDELMPFVHNWLPASTLPEDNYLCGLSMGAAATWMYGLYKPELFGAIAPVASSLRKYSFLEPYRQLSADEFRKQALSDRKAFPSGYGNPANGIQIKEINMITKYSTVGDFLDSYECTWERFAEVVKEGRLPRTYMTCGTGDRSYNKVLELKEYAQSLDAGNIEYDFVPDHSGGYAYCDLVMPRIFDFFEIA